MKTKLRPCLFSIPLWIVCSFLFFSAAAQTPMPAAKIYRVGIFAPLYLDSIFTGAETIRYTDNLPKFMTPGLEFIHGAQIALDSINTGQQAVEAYIYDTKSNTQTVAQLISNKKLPGFDLLIGAVKDAEFKQLADFALAKNIPFISATYPNDGGIVANPFMVVMNTTLKAHCEAIFTYLLQNHGTDKIFLCRQQGAQEDKVATYFKMSNGQEGRPLLDIQTLNFDSTISPNWLKTKLDSNRQTVIIGGSLDESFAASLVGACYLLQDTYPLTLVGMPNWDNFKTFTKKNTFEDFPIYYTTPYFNSKTDGYSKMVKSAYTKKYHTKPTDLAYKGFESTALFIKLLLKYNGDLMNHLNEKSAKIFTDYNFRPVMLKKEAYYPDYFENKHVYFMKVLNGATSKAW